MNRLSRKTLIAGLTATMIYPMVGCAEGDKANITYAGTGSVSQGAAKVVVTNLFECKNGKSRAAGIGEIAITNTYYVGLLLNSSNPEEVKVGERVGIFFPNQDGRGTHVNVSGIGITKNAPNKENAIKFIEFVTSEEIQKIYANESFELDFRLASAKGGLVSLPPDSMVSKIGIAYESDAVGQGWNITTLVFEGKPASITIGLKIRYDRLSSAEKTGSLVPAKTALKPVRIYTV